MYYGKICSFGYIEGGGRPFGSPKARKRGAEGARPLPLPARRKRGRSRGQPDGADNTAARARRLPRAQKKRPEIVPATLPFAEVKGGKSRYAACGSPICPVRGSIWPLKRPRYAAHTRRVVAGVKTPPQSAINCRQLPIATGSHGEPRPTPRGEHVISTE